MTPRTVAIMQPTYLPWIGYFNLIDRVDCFVFLDSVQFSKRSWQQRNRVKGDDKTLWLTVPVLSKGLRQQRIADVEIDLSASFHQKHLKTLDHLYGKAPFFQQYIGGLADLLNQSHKHLGDLNIELIELLCSTMGIKTEMIRSSSLDVEGRKSELLVGICEALGAGQYVSAEGSREYIEEEDLFSVRNIELDYHEYHHPAYHQQFGEFVPYLSAVDLLFNEGPTSLEVIKTGRGNSSHPVKNVSPNLTLGPHPKTPPRREVEKC